MHNNQNMFNQRNQMLNKVSEVSQSQEDRASERGFRGDQQNGKSDSKFSESETGHDCTRNIIFLAHSFHLHHINIES
jgi:hypothetical protein